MVFGLFFTYIQYYLETLSIGNFTDWQTMSIQTAYFSHLFVYSVIVNYLSLFNYDSVTCFLHPNLLHSLLGSSSNLLYRVDIFRVR